MVRVVAWEVHQIIGVVKGSFVSVHHQRMEILFFSLKRASDLLLLADRPFPKQVPIPRGILWIKCMKKYARNNVTRLISKTFGSIEKTSRLIGEMTGFHGRFFARTRHQLQKQSALRDGSK